jgi:3-deoxy-manno-octulosonate cytidylyltransferase (CMP-KDO synthetase)|tara:strand:- start:921 stop:1658 length:738 start_codon:yes stop_codon:yes gene_type:complete
MNKTAIIIPSRLDAMRLPSKPLKLINNKEMILHVYEAALKANAGEVYVATPDEVIVDLIKKFGGNSVLTSKNHATGTDRVFQVFKETLNNEPNIIVNLQGDMPNIDSKDITNLINYMQKEECSIGTLASKLKSNYELKDKNIVKVCVKEKMRPGEFVQAEDFVRTNPNKLYQVYHHIGIYAFTNKALIRYVGLKRSKLELQRNLEQLRAMENNISIHVGFVESSPLSVDTEKDLIEVKKLMEKNG